MNKSFLWGAATSSHQIEGYNHRNDWWAWEQEGNIEGGIRSGSATDHWNRFREDIQLAADLGLNSYRFSVEWSRIEPEPGVWDHSALDWYQSLIAECEKHQLLPMLTLHHFTSPLWFSSQGGFTQENAHLSFSNYVKKVAQVLGPHIPLWCTLNEPGVLVAGGYLGKFMPPAIFSPELAARANASLLRCHIHAYQILKSQIPERKGPWKNLPLSVGIAHNVIDFFPDRKWNLIEQVLAYLLSHYYNRAWLDAITGCKQHFGIPGVLPKPPVVTEALGKNSADFIGINYYTKAYVKWRPRDGENKNHPKVPVSLSFARRKEAASDLGWAIHPHGLKKMLKLVQQYHLPIYITENGIADRDDQKRPEYLRSHLSVVSQAIQDGMDIRGYYYWSLLDNFEWIKGYWPKFGLYQVNYETFERKLTHSADLLKSIIRVYQESESSFPSSSEIEKIFKR